MDPSHCLKVFLVCKSTKTYVSVDTGGEHTKKYISDVGANTRLLFPQQQRMEIKGGPYFQRYSNASLTTPKLLILTETVLLFFFIQHSLDSNQFTKMKHKSTRRNHKSRQKSSFFLGFFLSH